MDPQVLSRQDQQYIDKGWETGIRPLRMNHDTGYMYLSADVLSGSEPHPQGPRSCSGGNGEEKTW